MRTYIRQPGTHLRSISIALRRAYLTASTRRATASCLAAAFLCLCLSRPAVAQVTNFTPTGDTDLSQFKGNETDPAVAVNPNNPTNVFVASVSSATNGLFTAYITNFPNGTATTPWTQSIIASSGTNFSPTKGSSNLVAANGEPSVAWDLNSNLFLAYEPSNYLGIAVAVSTNGGKSFFALTNLATNDATDQPRIAAGVVAGTNIGSVWLVYKDYSLFSNNVSTPLVVQGLQTTNIGTNGIGTFSAPAVVPGSANGYFPDVAVGPSNQVMVAYQNNINSSSASSVFVNVNTNVLLNNAFGSAITVTTDAVGGLTYIPAANSADGINAGVGLAWDVDPTSIYYGRVYLAYTAIGSNGLPSMNICTRYSVNNGSAWSAELQVNDDVDNYSHFLPRIALDPYTGSVALCWCDCRNDTGPSSTQVIGPIITATATNTYTNIFDLDGTPNDDYMIYGTVSLSGGTSYAPNAPMFPIWTATTLTAAQNAGTLAAGASFSYSSEAALANNGNGIGHHLGLTYASGNVYPVWPDNSDYLPGGAASSNPGPTQDFDLYISSETLQTAALALSVTETPYPPTSDEILAYYVVLTNHGPATASSVLITNQLADNVTLVGQQSPAPGGTYYVTNNGEEVVFSFPSLAKNTSITNLIRVTATQSGYATNATSVGSSLPNTLNYYNVVTNITNSAFTTSSSDGIDTNIVLVDGEDLGIGLSASPSNVDITSPVTYTVTVTNFGPAANGLVYVTNTLSSDLSQITNVSTPQGSYTITGNTIVFSLGTLASNQSVTMTYQASALSLGTKFQTATNVAVVTSTDFDPNLSNNIVTNTGVAIIGEQLAVGLTASPLNVNIGDTITYTLTITNLGASTNATISFTNTITSNVDNVQVQSASPFYPSGSVTVSGNTNYLIFNLGADSLGDGGVFTMVYTAVARSISTTYTNIDSFVTAVSTDFETNSALSMASVIVTENGEDLALGLSASPATGYTGAPITYTDFVTNLGPSTNAAVSVTNILSTNQSSITVMQSPGSYTINGNTIVFQDGALGVGQIVTNIFTAIPTRVGTATNLAVVTSPDFDTNLLNNTNSVTTTVVSPPPPMGNYTVSAFASSAIIAWTTPINATVQVAYGLTTNYGNVTSLSGPSTNHIILLTGLAQNTNYYFSAYSWWNEASPYVNPYITNGSFTTTNSLILNTQDAAYSNFWLQGPLSVSGYYGTYYNETATTQYVATASATYAPSIIMPGLYNVYAWYPQSTNFSTNAKMTVFGATNTISESVNQTTNGGNWFALATNIYFAVGTGGNVTIYNNTGETNKYVVANAMMWLYNTNQDYVAGAVPGWWADFYFPTNPAAASAYYSDYITGTDPYDPTTDLNFWVTFPATNTVVANFSPYQAGRLYQLQISTNLSSPWLTLSNLAPAIQTNVLTNGGIVFSNGTGYGAFTTNFSNTMFFRLSVGLGTNN